MKTFALCFAVLVMFAASLPAQPPEGVTIPSTAVSARDGFTQGKTGILFTHGGVPHLLRREVVLENGLRVKPDGSAILPNGQKANIGNNQLLTPQGSIEDVALTPEGTAPVTSAGSPVQPKQ